MRTKLTFGKTLDFYSLSGRVVSTNKSFETRMQAQTTVSSGGGNIYGSNGNISGHIAPTHHTTTVNSQTIEHQEIFLEDAAGQQHALKLWDWGVSCAPGHELTLVWAVPLGMGSGPYLHIKNHTTRKDYRQNQQIEDLSTDKNFAKWLLMNGALFSVVIVPGIAWYKFGWFAALIVAIAWTWFIKMKVITAKNFGDHPTDLKTIRNAIDAQLQAAEPTALVQQSIRSEGT